MSARIRACVVVTSVLLGCGGGAPPAESPEEPSPVAEPVVEPEPEAMADSEEEAEPEEDQEAAASQPATPEPQFPENATVEEAIAAVPRGAERLNVDPDELGKPLQDPELYAPCKLGGSHFTMRIAVWNGKAVGIDVTSKNAKLADCIKEQVRGIEWPDKVRSLNTVEYSF